MYLILTTLSLALVFGSSAIMSISGLISVFSNNTSIIICMGLGMEGGKILIVSHLYRTWPHYNIPARTGYIFVVIALTLLTSFELTGYLSRCYQKTAQNSHVIQLKVDALSHEESVLRSQIEVIDSTLKGLPESHVSRRIQERKNSNYKDKQSRLLEIIKLKADLETRLISIDDNLNPISSIAKILKTKESNVISIFILFLVLILEPLSIGLTIATNAAWMNHNQNRDSAAKEIDQDKNDFTKELRKLQEENHLTASQIQKITGRKKLKTCEGWLEGTTPTPPRVLKKIETWVEKRVNSQKPISLIKTGGEK